MKYHIKNKISKRELRKQGKNIIPLMKKEKYDEVSGVRIDEGGDIKDTIDCRDIQMSEDDC